LIILTAVDHVYINYGTELTSKL
ncbi:hypothetical protein SS7213T_03180, partial [Staphylococcus simiae CCM 7213 = CCUG 51256]